jgi:hypothetical protein
VFEVKAGEVVVSDCFPTGFTLRFPRVINIRDDKNIESSFKFEELRELVENFGERGKLKKDILLGQEIKTDL